MFLAAIRIERITLNLHRETHGNFRVKLQLILAKLIQTNMAKVLSADGRRDFNMRPTRMCTDLNRGRIQMKLETLKTQSKSLTSGYWGLASWISVARIKARHLTRSEQLTVAIRICCVCMQPYVPNIL
jgi:hypothetical protein